MSRTIRLALAAVAVAGAVAPVPAATAYGFCKLYTYEEADLDPRDGTVSPGRHGMVC